MTQKQINKWSQEFVNVQNINSNFTELYRSKQVGLDPWVLSTIKQGLSGNKNARIVVISDSIGDGLGSSDKWNLSWVALLRNAINNAQNGAFFAEDSVNFNIATASLACANLTSTTGTFGTAGALKESLNLAVGQTLVFSGNYQIIDFFYERSSGAGSAEIRRDGTVVATKSMSGATASDICTYSGAVTDTKDVFSTWTITALTAPIVITGLIRRKLYTKNALTVTRATHGSYSTADFNSAQQIASLKALGAYDSANTVFLIQLGANNIINGAKATTAATYVSQMSSLISGLTTAISRCVILPPRKTNESLLPPITEPYINYLNGLLEACVTLGVSIIDTFSTDFTAINAYSDGVHRNDYGNSLEAFTVLDALGIPVTPFIYRSITDPTYKNSWGFLAGWPVKTAVVGNDVQLQGILQRNGSTNPISIQVAVDARPVFAANNFVCKTDIGTSRVDVSSSGDISITDWTGISWVDLTPIRYKIRNDIF